MYTLEIGDNKLMHGDCLERMREIPDGSVDMVLTDPPYGNMKGCKEMPGNADGYQWDTTIDHLPLIEHLSRILRPNGTCVLFSQEPYTGKLTTEFRPVLPFAYRLTWDKGGFANALGCNKAPVNYTEDVIVFFKKYPKHDHGGGNPIRPYAREVFDFVGLSKAGVNRALKHTKMDHFFRFDSSQFKLCTPEAYAQFCEKFWVRYMPGFKEYGELLDTSREFTAELNSRMSREAPKVFNLQGGARHMSNLLRFKKPSSTVHPTQKPVALMEYLIKTYTRAGDTVLDFTTGSGTTGVACVKTGRKFIGIEMNDKYFSITVDRIAKETFTTGTP